MATKEIVLSAEETIPSDIATLLERLFGSDALQKVRSRGLKLKIVVTSPWPKPPRAKKEKFVIDHGFVDELKTLAADESGLENKIGRLSKPEILKIAAFLEVPMSKTAKLSSLRAQLQRTLRSEIVWKSIAGQPVAGDGALDAPLSPATQNAKDPRDDLA